MKIRHVVLFTFYKSVSRDERARAVETLKKMRGIVPGMIEWSIGGQIRPGGKCDLAEIATFKDEQSLREFQEHPVHKAAGELFSKIADWDVVDFLEE